jgi:hypothetical protein
VCVITSIPLTSASKRKLHVYVDGDCQKVPSDFDAEHDTGTGIQVAPKGNIITDVVCLNNVIAVLLCPKCDGRGVSLIPGEHNSGFAVQLTLNCVTCGNSKLGILCSFNMVMMCSKCQVDIFNTF